MNATKNVEQLDAPVVLLHSLGTDERLWRYQVEEFGRLGEVYTPLTCGHGGADWPGSASIAAWVADLHEQLVDIGPVHLVGLSMGGMQAAAFAAEYPELVRTLAIANSFVNLPPEIVTARISGAETGVAESGIAGYAATYLEQTLTQPISAADRQSLLDSIAEMSPEAYLGSVHATFAGDVSDALGQVSCPTLVIAAAEDVKTPITALQRFADGIERAKLTVIPAAGHLSSIENPKAFNEALLDFWRAASGRSANEPVEGARV